MAAAASRSTANTKLVIGKVEVGVGLFSTVAKSAELTSFATAGPNGGVLTMEKFAGERKLSSDEPMPEIDAVKGDPLGEDPGRDTPPITDSQALGDKTRVEAQYTQKLVEQGSGQIVEPDEVRKGIRDEDGNFTDLTDHLRHIEEITKLEQMEVVRFIDVGQVERMRVASSYYVGASEPEGATALRLIYEAMKSKRRVAVVKWSAKSRQSLGVLTAHGDSGTLVLLKLTWAEDFREPPAKALSVAKAGVNPAQVEMAERLIDAMHGTVDALDELRDDAIVLREDLIADVEAGNVLADVEPAPVIPTMSPEQAFEESIAALTAGKA